MPKPNRIHGIFANRTLNMRAIKAVGYDMDYTLVHYHVRKWEQRAYDYLRNGLDALGWPVAGLQFEPALALRGLVIDGELGNVVKANRFGYVKRAFHGIRPLPFEDQRHAYSRTLVDLREPRWRFLNTLFSTSECCMYMQLVEHFDRGELPRIASYAELYDSVHDTLSGAHTEGKLKAEIIADPDDFVDLDELVPITLLDQKQAGKKVLLITNSDWTYAAPMMSFAFDRYLPGDQTWRDLFDLCFFSARKPRFFSAAMPLFDIVDDEGLLREHHGPLEPGGLYVGGNAMLVEGTLGLSGEEILYVGDHVFEDVNITKNVLRWRTALVLRELEAELEALAGFGDRQAELATLMAQKTEVEAEISQLRLLLQRAHAGYGPQPHRARAELEREIEKVRARIVDLDNRIAPLAKAAGELQSENWGLLMRTGADKSHLARQVERYADVYTSRVSNFYHHTPYVYLRSPRGSLPHDPGPG